MELKDAIYERQSMRDFSDREISDADLKEIVTDASRAPSWANSQPWQVFIAKGGMLARIKQQHAEWDNAGRGGNSDIDTIHRGEWAPVAQQNMQQWSNQVLQELGNNMAASMKFSKSQHQLFNASAIVYLVLPKDAAGWSLYDLGAFGQTLMLSATDHGIQSIPAYELVKFPNMIRKEFKIGDNQMIAMGIALGYAKTDEAINQIYTKRTPVDSFLTIKD